LRQAAKRRFGINAIFPERLLRNELPVSALT
jgi:hypothetical protein